MREGAKTVAVMLAALLLTGCPIVDSTVQQRTREYFPKAIVSKPHPTLLQIDTCVENVSQAFGQKAFLQMAEGQEGRELLDGMRMAGYRYFAISFGSGKPWDTFYVSWDAQAPQKANILTTGQMEKWFRDYGGTWSGNRCGR